MIRSQMAVQMNQITPNEPSARMGNSHIKGNRLRSIRSAATVCEGMPSASSTSDVAMEDDSAKVHASLCSAPHPAQLAAPWAFLRLSLLALLRCQAIDVTGSQTIDVAVYEKTSYNMSSTRAHSDASIDVCVLHLSPPPAPSLILQTLTPLPVLCPPLQGCP